MVVCVAQVSLVLLVGIVEDEFVGTNRERMVCGCVPAERDDHVPEDRRQGQKETDEHPDGHAGLFVHEIFPFGMSVVDQLLKAAVEGLASFVVMAENAVDLVLRLFARFAGRIGAKVARKLHQRDRFDQFHDRLQFGGFDLFDGISLLLELFDHVVEHLHGITAEHTIERGHFEEWPLTKTNENDRSWTFTFNRGSNETVHRATHQAASVDLFVLGQELTLVSALLIVQFVVTTFLAGVCVRDARAVVGVAS